MEVVTEETLDDAVMDEDARRLHSEEFTVLQDQVDTILHVVSQVEELDNHIYKLTQRVDMLERNRLDATFYVPLFLVLAMISFMFSST